MRIFLAGLLGGVAMFIWVTIAHMVLPLGEAGTSEVPNESAVLEVLQTNISTPGLYLFPGLGLGPNPSRAQKHAAMKQMMENFEREPSGFLMFFPRGTRSMAIARWMSIEFVTELIESFLVVFLLSLTRLTTFGSRLGFITLAGVLTAIATNVSYWNWYGFPATYTSSYMFIQIVGFACIGVVAALILKNQPTRVTS
jgi:hypothetical protein